MKNILLAVILCAAAPASARGRRASSEQEPPKESWNSMKMEATAIMGELKYQHGDLSGARDTFRDSLNSSTKLLSPQDHVVGLDLYRTAELAARRGDFPGARQHLDILISRFPDTEWAQKGQRLRDMLPRDRGAAGDEFEPVTAVVTGDQPEFMLGRIQASTRAGASEDALEICRQFLQRHSRRPEAEEVRLLGGALYLKLGRVADAARTLKFLADNGRDAEVRAKAIHLLAAADLAAGDFEAARQAVPDVEPGRAFSPWLSRAQVMAAYAEERLGRRAAAMRRYRLFLDTALPSPVRAQALGALALESDRQGKPAEAAAMLALAAQEAGRWSMEELKASAELGQAHLLYKLRRFAQAAEAYSLFARSRPSHPQRAMALYQQGLSLKRVGRHEPAAAAFAEIVEKAPRSVYAVDAQLQLGQLYTELGAADKAVAAYRSMGQSGEKRGERESLLLIAQVHYNQKRFKDAIPLYWTFLERNPDDARRAEVEDLLLTSYWLGARSDPGLLKAVSLFARHPIVAHIRWELGAEAYQAADFAKAAKLFESFAEDYPRSPHAAESLFFLGEARLKLGDPGAASGAYRAVLERFPKSPQAALSPLRLAAALFSAGDYDASARAYARAAQGAAAPDALFNSALALSKAGQKRQALEAYENLLKRFPRHPKASWAWLQVAQGREAEGDLASAADAYWRVSADADRPAALFAAGRLREKLRQSGQAARAYEALRACRPAADASRLRGLLRLGLLYELGEQPLKAMPLYHEILKLTVAGSPDFQAALQRVQTLTSDGALARPPAAR